MTIGHLYEAFPDIMIIPFSTSSLSLKSFGS